MVDLEANTVLLVIGGSRAYGLHGPGSDVDVKGACVPPRAAVLGIFERFEQVDDAARLAPLADWLTDEERLGAPGYNPGGLVAVWAEENTRAAIFDALKASLHAFHRMRLPPPLVRATPQEPKWL